MPRRSRSSLRAGAKGRNRAVGGGSSPVAVPRNRKTTPSRVTSVARFARTGRDVDVAVEVHIADERHRRPEPRRRGTAGAIYARCGDDRSPPMPPRKEVSRPPSVVTPLPLAATSRSTYPSQLTSAPPKMRCRSRRWIAVRVGDAPRGRRRIPVADRSGRRPYPRPPRSRPSLPGRRPMS